MSKTAAALRAAYARLIGYRIHAGSEWQAIHYAGTLADALAWARCYPQACPVTITRFGKFVAAR